MFLSMFGAVESGVIYALMALGVYLSFRILDFPDLTVDGSFVTGSAVAAVMIMNGTSPLLATVYATGAGFLAGCITGILHTKGKINNLLSGILMMIALYSINLRIMGSPQIPLVNEETLAEQIVAIWDKMNLDAPFNNMLSLFGFEKLPSTWGILIVMLIFVFIIKLFVDYFLKTEVGLALRATGNNEKMIRSFSANTDTLIIIGIGLANGLVALSGALIAQNGGFADVGLGVGMIIIGLASVIIGEAIFGAKTIFRATLAVLLGSIIYRIVVALALRADFLETGDMKLITAALVIVALITPKVLQNRREKKRRAQKQALLEMEEA